MSAPFASLLSIPAAVALAMWSLVGVGTISTVTATTHALTEPAGVQQGDLLIACISSRIASTTSITLPSGWTRVSESKTSNTTAGATTGIASACMAFIERGASAPALSFTHPVAPSVAQGRIIAYRGFQPASAVDASIGNVTATNVTSVSLAGITPTLVEDLIVSMMSGGQAAAWSNFRATTDPATGSGATDTTTPPTAGTFRERADDTTTTGADTSLGIFDAIKAVAGATGNMLCTASLGAGQAHVSGSFKRITSTWNPGRAAPGVTLSNGNRTATQSSSNVFSKICLIHGHSKGKFYFELTLASNIGGNFGVGVCSVGLDHSVSDTVSWCGITLAGCAWYPIQGQTYHTNASIGASVGSSAVSGNVIGIAYDIDAKLFWSRLQGGNYNGSGTANPATGTGGFSMANIAGIIVPCLTLYANGEAGTINVGGSAFANAPPTGFKPAGVP